MQFHVDQIFALDMTDERVQFILWSHVRSPMLIIFLGCIGFIGLTSKVVVIHYAVTLAPKNRPINTLILLDQAILLLTSVAFVPLILASLIMGTSLYDIIGSSGCQLFSLAITAHNCCLGIMGCVMALFRVIVIKWEIQGQAANRMLKRIIAFALVVMMAMIATININHQHHGTGLSLEFCHGHTFIMDKTIQGTSNDQFSLFYSLNSFMILVLQAFIGVELMLYSFLFNCLRQHNQKLLNSEILPTPVVHARHHKNLLTMSGQASTFVLETILSIVVLVLLNRGIGILEPAIHPLCVLVIGSLVSVSHVWSSPELRRHYKLQ